MVLVLALALESLALQAGEKPQKHLAGLEGSAPCCAGSGSTSDPGDNNSGDRAPLPGQEELQGG